MNTHPNEYSVLTSTTLSASNLKNAWAAYINQIKQISRTHNLALNKTDEKTGRKGKIMQHQALVDLINSQYELDIKEARKQFAGLARASMPDNVLKFKFDTLRVCRIAVYESDGETRRDILTLGKSVAGELALSEAEAAESKPDVLPAVPTTVQYQKACMVARDLEVELLVEEIRLLGMKRAMCMEASHITDIPRYRKAYAHRRFNFAKLIKQKELKIRNLKKLTEKGFAHI